MGKIDDMSDKTKSRMSDEEVEYLPCEICHGYEIVHPQWQNFEYMEDGKKKWVCREC